jgi:hypothetical protein
LLLKHAFEDQSTAAPLEHFLGEIADFCLRSPQGAAAARIVTRRLKAALLNSRAAAFTYTNVANALFEHQPAVALSIFLDGVAKHWWDLESLVAGSDGNEDDTQPNRRPPIAHADPAVCKAWVGRKPEVRTRLLAQAIPFSARDEQAVLQWTPLAQALLDGPFGEQALDAFAERFMPGYAWGGMVGQLMARRPLLDNLAHHSNPSLAARAAALAGELDQRITQIAAMEHDCGEQTFE